jgi:multisubunit Na+/H+ antiporter MnhB subunit
MTPFVGFEWMAFAASALILLYVAYGVGTLLGRCARWNLEMRLFVWLEWTAFAASVFILLRVTYWVGTFLYVFGPALVNPCMIAHGNFAKNRRGDLVEEQVRDCAIIGSAAEDRIGGTVRLSVPPRKTGLV